MRPWHYLRMAKAARQPRRIVALATESVECPSHADACLIPLRLAGWSAVKEKLRHGTPVGGESYHGDLAELWWRTIGGICAEGGVTWVMGWRVLHSLTLLGWWRMVEEGEWRMSDDDPAAPAGSAVGRKRPWRGLCVTEDPPTIMVARPRSGRGVIKVVDLANYGLESDPGSGPSGQRASAAMSWVLSWIGGLQLRGLGGLQTTAASQAWHAYRSRYLDRPLLCHGNKDAARLERSALVSGRCECFRIGKVTGPIYALDVKSCYPAICVGAKLPARLKHYYGSGAGELPVLLRDGWQVIARVTLRTKRPNFPLRKGGMTYYPVGRFETVLCGPELSLAIRQCLVESVGEVAAYEPSEMLSDYMRDMLAWRKEEEDKGSDGDAEVYKLLANSLIGKMSARSRRWERCEHWCPRGPHDSMYMRCPPGGPWRYHRAIAWECQHEADRGEARDGIAAVSAWVYSLGRVRMSGLIEKAGRHNAVYCDTDGIMVTHMGFSRLGLSIANGPAGPGDLRWQGTYGSVEVLGLKCVVLPGEHRCAGVPRGAVYLGGGAFRWSSPERVTFGARRGRAPEATLRRATWRIRHHYRHGVVGGDGYVLPLQEG